MLKRHAFWFIYYPTVCYGWFVRWLFFGSLRVAAALNLLDLAQPLCLDFCLHAAWQDILPAVLPNTFLLMGWAASPFYQTKFHRFWNFCRTEHRRGSTGMKGDAFSQSGSITSQLQTSPVTGHSGEPAGKKVIMSSPVCYFYPAFRLCAGTAFNSKNLFTGIMVPW